jgi:translation elongation factor P/translation initiation factor 5A
LDSVTPPYHESTIKEQSAISKNMETIEAKDLAVGTIYVTGESHTVFHKVKDISSVKNGKHGAAKLVVTGTDVFTGKAFQVRGS